MCWVLQGKVSQHRLFRACFISRLRAARWGGSRHRRAFRTQHPSFDPSFHPKSGTHPINTMPSQLFETGLFTAVLAWQESLALTASA